MNLVKLTTTNVVSVSAVSKLWVNVGPIKGAEFYWSGAQWPANPQVAYYFYARHYNARHPGQRVSWRRLNRPQRAEAERMFSVGLLGI